MDVDYEKYGRIVCAALLNKNCIYMSDIGHHAIFQMEPLVVLRSTKQGFVTENGFFVDRMMGLCIAYHFGQIDVKHNPKDELMSEDLKKEKRKVLNYIENYSYKK